MDKSALSMSWTALYKLMPLVPNNSGPRARPSVTMVLGVASWLTLRRETESIGLVAGITVAMAGAATLSSI